MLGLCKAGMAVSSILEASYLTHFQTYRLLWTLITLGIVTRDREGGSPAADLETPDAMLERFNDLFVYVHHRVSTRPEGLTGLKDALDEASRAHPALATTVPDLWQYGRLDTDAVLFSLRCLPEGERVPKLHAFLEEVFYAMVFAADRVLGADERGQLHAHIRARTRVAHGVE